VGSTPSSGTIPVSKVLVVRVPEEEPSWINPASVFLDKMPAEQRAQLNPEKVKRFSQAMVTMMNGQAQAGAWYTYDPQNRLTTTRDRNMMFEETTTVSYNTEGGKAEEQTNLTFNSPIPVGVPTG
jgi:YD repeat-containing protein